MVSIRGDQTDPRFGAVDKSSLGNCIIVWEPGDLTSITHLGAGATTTGVVLEENLWWSSDLAATREELGPLPGREGFPQVTNIDPALDEELRPTTEAVHKTCFTWARPAKTSSMCGSSIPSMAACTSLWIS